LGEEIVIVAKKRCKDSNRVFKWIICIFLNNKIADIESGIK
jgi:hypothetical protein